MEYKGIYEDFGWSHIEGHRLGGRQYWQKEDDDQNEIFSDRQSMANYYKSLMGYSFMLFLMFLAISVPNKDWGSLYHEGLWSMNGALFWKAFLFEIPFLLLILYNVSIALLFLICIYMF